MVSRLYCAAACAGMLLLCLTQLAHAEPTFHGVHVVFDNSAADRSYYHSAAQAVAPSTLEIPRGKLPVDADHFVSPPNGLCLSWQSKRGGDWRAAITLEDRYARKELFVGDTLVMWCYADTELTPENSPRVGIHDSQGNSRPSISLVASGILPAGKWVQLSFPLPNFGGQYEGTDESRFDAARLSRITFAQGLDDGLPHTLYIDDIRLVDSKSQDTSAPAIPQGLKVTGSDSHFDLSWAANSEADLLSYRIYRAGGGHTFEPVGTCRADQTRFVDFVGSNITQHSYRITAVDLSNNESAPSESAVGTTSKLADEALLDMVQQGCFRYYWEGANERSGMALEVRPGDENLIALGGSGFGISALVCAVDRHFVSREQGAERLLKILRFLQRADRFHGAWPHFLDGRTGHVWPLFGEYDNGADLVETAFLMQGLLTARQYFDRDTAAEHEIRETITKLWQEVEWDWFRKTPDSEVLYWHWSPDHGWHISHPLVGWNETMIVYLLAIASPTHPIPASMYHTGWAGQSKLCVDYRRGWSRTTDGDHYTNGHEYYGHRLDVGCGTGGDLFFSQFSFLGFDPRGIHDRYTNYFHNNRQLALINRAYCMANPRKREGYGPDCWGLSAGIHSGGGKPEPRNDNGTICTSAALGCMPYTPEKSLAALKHYYRDLGDKIWGIYGFHDGFNQTENWFDECYMGLNQAQIVVGIENYRTGLCWKMFMANPESQPMLDAIGFVREEAE